VVGRCALKYLSSCRSRAPLFTCGYIRESLQHYYTGLLHNWSSWMRVFFFRTTRAFHVTRGTLNRHHATFEQNSPELYIRGLRYFWPLYVISFILMLRFDIECSYILGQRNHINSTVLLKTFMIIDTQNMIWYEII